VGFDIAVAAETSRKFRVITLAVAGAAER